MALILNVVEAGWVVFAVICLILLFKTYLNRLQEISGRRPLSSPKRNAVRVALFAIVNLVWIGLMDNLRVLGGEGPQDFGNLICIWILLVPSTGFFIIMSYLIDQQRIRLTQEQLKSNEEAKQKPEVKRNTEG